MLRTQYAFEQKGGFGMVRKLLRSVREYKTSSLLAPLFVTCEVILEVIIPMLMANLIDFGIEAGNMQYILKMGLALVICCIVSLTFGALSGKYAAVASAGFAKNLREEMYNKAVNAGDNILTTPYYLRKLAFVYAEQGKTDRAIETCRRIKNDYASSLEARDIDKLIGEFGQR